MGMLENAGYKFRSEAERREALDWYSRHAELIPKHDGLIVEADHVKKDPEWVERLRTKILVEMSLPDIVEKAALESDEEELLNMILDGYTRKEVAEYYGMEPERYSKMKHSIKRKLAKIPG